MPEISEQDFAALAAQVASLSSALAVARRRIDDLEDGMTGHLGLDWGESLVDVNSPHPNISANTVEAGGGVVLVNDNGITVEQSTLNKALWFSESFWYGEPDAPGTVMPTTAGAQLSGSGDGTEGEFDLIVTSNLDYSFNSGADGGNERQINMEIRPSRFALSAGGSDFDWGDTSTSDPWHLSFWAGQDTGDGSQGSFYFSGMPISLPQLSWGYDNEGITENSGNYIHEGGNIWHNSIDDQIRVFLDGHIRTVLTAGNIFPDVISPSQITANEDDYNPLDFDPEYDPALIGDSNRRKLPTAWRLNTDASRNITGILYGAILKSIAIFNVGSFDIVLKDEDAGSTAANRFALNGDITLQPDNSTILWYDATSSRWRAV